MKRAGRQIAACAGILILFCVVCRFAFFRSYTAYVPIYGATRERLLQKRWKQELAGLILLMLFFGALTLALG